MKKRISRRSFLRASAVAGSVAVSAAVLAGCSSSAQQTVMLGQGTQVIGMVCGPLPLLPPSDDPSFTPPATAVDPGTTGQPTELPADPGADQGTGVVDDPAPVVTATS